MSFQYGWGVQYLQKGKLKQRNFKFDEAEARDFYRRKRCNLEGAQLFRYRPQTVLDQFLEGRMTWLGRSAPLPHVVLCIIALAALLTAWRLFP